MNKPDMLLWLSDSRGQYIPRDFANSFADREKSVAGVSAEQWACLEIGPWNEETDQPNESYWDVWTEVEDNAVITDEHGIKYFIYRNGDCWLVPEGMKWNGRTESFDWPSEDEEEAVPSEEVKALGRFISENLK